MKNHKNVSACSHTARAKLPLARAVSAAALVLCTALTSARSDTVVGQAMLNPFFTGNDYSGWTLNAPWRNDGGNDRLVFDIEGSNPTGFPTAIGQGVDLMTQSAITNAAGGYSALGARLMDFNFGASDPFVAVFGSNTNNGIYKLFFEVDVLTTSGLYRAKTQEFDTPQNLSGALDLNFSWLTGGSFLGDLEANGGTLLSGISSITYKAVMFVDTPASGGTAFFTLDNMSLEYVVDTLPVARWTGGSGEWTTGFSPAFYQEAPVEFSGAGGNVTNNVATNGMAVGAMTFAPGAGSYTLTAAGGASGESTNNPLIIAGNILNNSTATQTLALAVDLATNGPVDTAAGNIVAAGSISGSAGLIKQGAQTLVLSASNSLSGGVQVLAGTLELAGAGGNKAGGNVSTVSVATGATLLISQSSQFNTAPAVTLSGGTIQRASGVSEVFGSLNLTASSFLDFGGGTAGTITFSGIAYTPSALLALDIANFNQGSILVFQTTNNLSMTGFTFSGTGGFGSSSFDGSTFTITAIPEPSVIVAAAGLLATLLLATCRNIFQQAARSRSLCKADRCC